MHRLREFIQRAAALIRREQIFKVLAIVLLVTLAGSFGYIYFEEDIHFPDALWWSIVTLTTVGYGDIAPQTIMGQIFATLLMLTGYAILAVPTGIVSSEMSRVHFEKRYRNCPKCLKAMPEDAHYCSRCGERLVLAPQSEP